MSASKINRVKKLARRAIELFGDRPGVFTGRRWVQLRRRLDLLLPDLAVKRKAKKTEFLNALKRIQTGYARLPHRRRIPDRFLLPAIRQAEAIIIRLNTHNWTPGNKQKKPDSSQCRVLETAVAACNDAFRSIAMEYGQACQDQALLENAIRKIERSLRPKIYLLNGVSTAERRGAEKEWRESLSKCMVIIQELESNAGAIEGYQRVFRTFLDEAKKK